MTWRDKLCRYQPRGRLSGLRPTAEAAERTVQAGNGDQSQISDGSGVLAAGLWVSVDQTASQKRERKKRDFKCLHFSNSKRGRVTTSTHRFAAARAQSDFVEGQARYGRAICSWLNRCFPEIGAHPAAIACVIRLHYRDGRGNLRRSVHGDEIRAAVALFDDSFGPEPIERETV